MNASLCMTLLLIGATPDAPEWPFGPNGVANGTFEAEMTGKTIPGWTVTQNPKGCARVSLDTKDPLQGAASLRLDLPAAGAVTLQCSPVPVRPGSQVLVAYGFRHVGFSPTHVYNGVNCLISLRWRDRAGKQLGHVNVGHPYGACEWSFRDRFFQVPEKAASMTLAYHFSNHSKKHSGTNVPSALVVDAVQIRPYTPPPTPAEARAPAERIVEGGISTTNILSTFLANQQVNRYVGSKWAKALADPKAERGMAIQSPKDCGNGIMGHSPTRPALPPGLYRVILRAKVHDTTDTKAVGMIDIASQQYGIRLQREFRGRDFAKPDTYEWIEADFVSRGGGYWLWRVWTKGRQPLTVESIRIAPLATFNDGQLLDLFPGVEGGVSPKLQVKRGPRLRTLILAGPVWDYYSLLPVLRFADSRGSIDVAWVEKQYSQKLKGFPETAEALFDHDVVCLCNIDMRSLPLRTKHLLKTFVQRGGSLLVIGGHKAYGRGGVTGSLLEEVLPIVCHSGPSDWGRPVGDGILTARPDSPLVAGLSFAAKPRVYFLHRAKARPQADVLLKVGEQPALVLGAFGKGRVACLLATAHGAPGEGETPFWKWTGWPTFLRNVIWWLVKDDRRF